MVHTVAIFHHDNGARIIKTLDPEQYLNRSDCIVDPDLSGVKGIPPHLWKKCGGKVVPVKNFNVMKMAESVPAMHERIQQEILEGRRPPFVTRKQALLLSALTILLSCGISAALYIRYVAH